MILQMLSVSSSLGSSWPRRRHASDQVYRLLQDYGDHYDPYFGVDSRARLAGDPDAGLRCSVATHRVITEVPSLPVA